MSEDDDRPACLICGRRFDSVARHVHQAHGITAVEYRDRFGIRRSASLSSPAAYARASAAIRIQIDAGIFAAHYAGNAARAATANKAAITAKRELRASGVELWHGRPVTPREVLEAIVAEIEAGLKIGAAVNRSAISETAFRAGLARYPDLQGRVNEAKWRRRDDTIAHARRRRSIDVADSPARR